MLHYDFDRMRSEMVTAQLEKRGISDQRVLEACRKLPRHLFVPVDFRPYAYDDGPLPIGLGQTISQPYIVALMTSLLSLRGSEKVLEIGTGSGYQAAVLAHLCAEVHTIERHAALAERAVKMLRLLGMSNVTVHASDGSLGWVEAAPYQGIIVTAAAPRPPVPLLDQLDEDGRLVIPIGGLAMQELEVWIRHGEDFTREAVLPVSFVPLRGAHGWGEADWPEDRRW